MVTVVVFEFGVMRCQPLRRALEKWRNHAKDINNRDFIIDLTWISTNAIG